MLSLAGAVVGAFATRKAGRAVGSGGEAVAASLDRGSARLADAAIRGGDLIGKHIASSFIHTAGVLSTLGNQWLERFDEVVARALTQHQSNVQEALSTIRDEGEQWRGLVNQVTTQLDEHLQQFKLLLGLLTLLLAIGIPLVHSELTGNTKYASQLWTLIVFYFYTIAHARLFYVIFLIPPYIFWRALLLVADVLYTVHLLEFTSKGQLEVGHEDQLHDQVPAVPAGCIAAYAGGQAPPGWLPLDGQTYPSTTYPALAAILGVIPAPNVVFQLPDLRGRTIVGSGNGNGLAPRDLLATGGAENVVLGLAHLPAHIHQFKHVQWIGGDGLKSGGGHGQVGFSGGGNVDNTGAAGSDNPAPVPIMPPFTALQFLIKT